MGLCYVHTLAASRTLHLHLVPESDLARIGGKRGGMRRDIGTAVRFVTAGREAFNQLLPSIHNQAHRLRAVRLPFEFVRVVLPHHSPIVAVKTFASARGWC